jgi:hypothetical protein
MTRQAMTREAHAGTKWQDKWHPMGRASNHMNEITYQPQWPPDPASLDNHLSPLHRAECLEALQAQGLPIPDRRLTMRDYYTAIGGKPTDPYEGSPYKVKWEADHPDTVDELNDAWADFIGGLHGV